MYSFHGSAAAYMDYWNNSFGVLCQSKPFKISHCQIWQAFVQESTQTIASTAGLNLELKDGLALDEVTKEAFNILGENGLIRAADQHECSECTQKYKATSDIVNGADPAAVVGVDENRIVPPLQNPNNELNAQNALQAENIQVDHSTTEPAPVKMIVMDGIVMGAQHCAFDDCTASLVNSHGGVFCAVHNTEYGVKCRVHGCPYPKIGGTQACHQHREDWLNHQFNRKPDVLAGVR